MKLSELYKVRMAALPELTRKELVDTVGSATVYAIQHDVPRRFRKATLHKLAELWKCSAGDIQACLAEMPNPLRKEAEKREGVIDKKSAKKKAPAPDPEEPETEPAEVFTPAEPDETDDNYGFKVPEQQLRDSIVDEKSEMFIRDTAIAFYKGRLKDMCIQKLAMASGNNVTDVYTEIGYELVKELVK